ncbi:uncharacterized protein [Aegilops tauschii subsp. strangulata]|uniref:uncharacterized protein n=1 Tax=Aegilops tauschii subsp. strangulata TaxID=200361 RepID=UPI001ABC25A3|nr:uncharacterized protein LOC109750157 [Aegilops tauschii subsp. strangulata]
MACSKPAETESFDTSSLHSVARRAARQLLRSPTLFAIVKGACVTSSVQPHGIRVVEFVATSSPWLSASTLFHLGCSKKQDSQVHLLDAFQYIYFPLERPGRSQPPPQAVQRHLRRRFIAKTATWIPLVPTSNARSSTSSLSCCSVAQLLHLVEGAMEVGNRGDSAMELEAEVSLFAAATSGSPVPGGVAHRPGGWASRTASRPTSATTTSSRLLLARRSQRSQCPCQQTHSSSMLQQLDSIWGNAQAIRGVSMRLPFQLRLRCK